VKQREKARQKAAGLASGISCRIGLSRLEKPLPNRSTQDFSSQIEVQNDQGKQDEGRSAMENESIPGHLSDRDPLTCAVRLARQI
jgi:hypothetical protein